MKTQEEILEYNKRCAEFLGWKKCLTHEFDSYNYCQVVDGYITPFNNIIADPQILEYNSSIFEHSISDMQFHSDWNWIIEVLKFITKIGYNWELINFNGTVEEVNFMKCSIFDLDFDNRIKFVFESSDEKEAVVQAINQFLIWYKENNK